jgi:Tol biopolymer transport system component
MTLRIAARWLFPLFLLATVAIGVAFAIAVRLPRGPQLAFLSTCNGWENIFLADIDLYSVQPLTCSRTTKSQLAWSSDGEYLAYYNNGAAFFTLNIMEVASGHIETFWFEDRIYANISQPLSWSPDGTEIAFVGITQGNTPQTLFALDLGSGEIRQLTLGDRDALDPAWSPNDPNLLVFRRADGLYQLDPYNPQTVPVRFDSTQQMTWSTSGAQVLFSLDENRISVRDVDGSVRDIPMPGGVSLSDLTVSPRADEIGMTVSFRSGLYLYRVDTLTGIGTALLQSRFYLGQPKWSPDGRWMAYVDSRNGGDDIALYDLERGVFRSITNGGDRDWSPIWRPPG